MQPASAVCKNHRASQTTAEVTISVGDEQSSSCRNLPPFLFGNNSRHPADCLRFIVTIYDEDGLRLANTPTLPTPAQAFEEARKIVDNKVEEQTGRWRVSDFGRFIPIPRKVALKRWTEGYLSPGVALSFLPRY